MHRIISLTCILLAISATVLSGSILAEGDYDMGQPIVKQIWVDPVNGNDVWSGNTKDSALKTLNVAMGYIPTSMTFTTGYKIMLMPGTYTSDNSPSTYSYFQGTAKYPLIFNAVNGAGTVHMPSMTLSDCQYFYVIGADVMTANGADAISASHCDHVFLKSCTVDGFGASDSLVAQNTVSFVGSKYCYAEDCTFKHSSGALLYMSGVQYGHAFRCRMDSTLGSGMNVTSGSAYLYLERNTITNVVQNGFILGGFDFLDYDFTTPWLHYDVYDVRVDNNAFSNCAKEAFIASGSYDVLIEYNTFYRCGGSAATLFVAGIGRRTCYGDKSTCSDLIAAGAWGTLHSYATDDDVAWIPNKHLYIYNNLFYNPSGAETQYAELSVWGSRKALAHATCPKPALADDDIRIKGNVLFNGQLTKALGLADTSGCQDTNSLCNKTTLTTENTINLKEPDLASADFGNLHPVTGSFLFAVTIYTPPDFVWNDLPGKPVEPQGDLSTAITVDREGYPRTSSTNAAGAYATPNAGVRSTVASSFAVSDPTQNPASTSSAIVLTTAERAFVSAGVFDLLGREVATIASRSFDPGEYHLDVPVQTLANGVYLIRVVAAGQTICKQLVVTH